MLQDLVTDDIEAAQEGDGNALLRENADGELEEVVFESEPAEEVAYNPNEESAVLEDDNETNLKARVMLWKDMAAAAKVQAEQDARSQSKDEQDQDMEEDLEHDEEAILDDAQSQEYMNAYDEAFEGGEDLVRTHPATLAGRFATSPTTLHLPRETLIDPITRLLADVPNKHLSEGALRLFGGESLPDSVATPATTRHLQQKAVALEASQFKMSDMDANAYLAAMMPGAYASVMSTLVETRKRLGSEWLEGLLNKPGGPRVLDAGAGGAGALACHEVFRAEWERMDPNGASDNPVPVGKTTVIAGSSELRRRISTLLEDTTFLPRLPDFIPSRDLPGSEAHDPNLRKQYDIIVAPHTLWTLKEDYMRKAQVQNYWTLLNPDGGVLILIEKGVPRGFELVAGARELLLNQHISSPGSSFIEHELQAPTTGRFMKKETGMIIAPCTNHGVCPMYKVSGQMQGRKDYCHFSQRFLRPRFLQNVLGVTHRNHEDIQFSYLAVQRGVDLRGENSIAQDETATQTALKGFEHDSTGPNMLALPRMVLPPLKRHKHVTFDLCTPSAQLERWIIPKSFSTQGYRDARKARWGDLWALGAKTRVLRTARSGSLKGESKRPRVIEIGVGAHEGEDTLRDITKGKRDSFGKKGKKGKKSKRERRPERLTEDDIDI